MHRRRFLKLAVGSAVGVALWPILTAGKKFSTGKVSASPYKVGVGNLSDPYDATVRAIEASGEFPDVEGRIVLIKPNLIAPLLPDSGVTTDPQVVRAVVDAALELGVNEIKIIEGGGSGPHFSPAGYDFFSGYDQRVSLVNLNTEPHDLYPVGAGLAFAHIYLPKLVVESDPIIISVAKMKTHTEALATLSIKNLVGLPPWWWYRTSIQKYRFALHDRGINQSITDLNLACPVDYAVVDGIWSMEGDGPTMGNPIKTNVVTAGLNSVAVDRTCLEVMRIPQRWVQHLKFAADKGLGPEDFESIDVVGDLLPSYRFSLPIVPPVISIPDCQPKSFAPTQGESVEIAYQVDRFSRIGVEIVQTNDVYPWVMPHFRTVKRMAWSGRGTHQHVWDGKDDDGAIVPAGSYVIRVRGYLPRAQADSYSTTWVMVTSESVRNRSDSDYASEATFSYA